MAVGRRVGWKEIQSTFIVANEAFNAAFAKSL